MQYRNAADIDRLVNDGSMSPAIARQLKAQFEASRSAPVSRTAGKRASTKRLPVSGESKGEASVRIALEAAFGLWHKGGEVVPELVPFEDRGFRVDFCLPCWKVYVEVDGWSHHGEHLADHHADRERGLYFSARGWVPFRVSHSQAINSPSLLTDAIQQYMELVDPLPRKSIVITHIECPKNSYNRLSYV